MHALIELLIAAIAYDRWARGRRKRLARRARKAARI